MHECDEDKCSRFEDDCVACQLYYENKLSPKELEALYKEVAELQEAESPCIDCERYDCTKQCRSYDMWYGVQARAGRP